MTASLGHLLPIAAAEPDVLTENSAGIHLKALARIARPSRVRFSSR